MQEMPPKSDKMFLNRYLGLKNKQQNWFKLYSLITYLLVGLGVIILFASIYNLILGGAKSNNSNKIITKEDFYKQAEINKTISNIVGLKVEPENIINEPIIKSKPNILSLNEPLNLNNKLKSKDIASQNSEVAKIKPKTDLRMAKELPLNELLRYNLQLDAGNNYIGAEKIKAELALLGIVADIYQKNIDDKQSSYHVRIGPLRDKALALQYQKRIRTNNLGNPVLVSELS